MEKKWRKGRLLLTGLLLTCMLVGCGKKDNQPFTYRGASEPEKEEQTSQEQQKEYIIKELNMAEETITVLSEENGRLMRFSYGLSTRFLDKYGNRCSSVHFAPGQVVILGEKNEKSIVESIQLSDTVWNYEEVSNYKIDLQQKILHIGESKYRLGDNVLAFSQDVEIPLDQVGTDDVLHVVGRDKDVISIQITTGHGYLQLVNTTLFQDSLLCVGNRIFTTITGDIKIEVPEGEYPLTVANNGYGGTTQISIVRNETTVVDLDQLKGEGPKMCSLTLETNVAGATVYIDGNQITVGEALQVTYGAHRLSIVAEGYESWEKTLIVNSASATIALDMEEETQQNTTDGETSSNNTTQNNTSTTEKTTEKDTSSDSSSEKKSEISDAEVDYLTTLSGMLTKMLTQDL